MFLIGLIKMIINKIKVILKRNENFEIVYKKIIKVKCLWYNDNKMLLYVLFIISVVCVFE